MIDRIFLAPMEGLADDVLRGILSAMGVYDACVCEFVRVSGTLLPRRAFLRRCPELGTRSRTASGTPVRVQLLGSDPVCLQENAARLVKLLPAGIDLNFGCPAPTVNRHRGGGILLDEPELLHAIAAAVRRAVPAGIPLSAKMRLGVADPGQSIACAQALAAGGVDELVVHGRTVADAYRPPARWAWIGRVREAVAVPVIANGEIWSEADYHRCRADSGCTDVMLGRGAVADPLLVARLRGAFPESLRGQGDDEDWERLRPHLALFWQAVQRKVTPRHAPGRLKQWLGLLRRRYPAAETLYWQLRPLRQPDEISARLEMQK